MVLHCTSPVVQKSILIFNTRLSSGVEGIVSSSRSSLVADIDDLTSFPGLVSALWLGGWNNCKFIYEKICFAQRPDHFLFGSCHYHFQCCHCSCFVIALVFVDIVAGVDVIIISVISPEVSISHQSESRGRQ